MKRFLKKSVSSKERLMDQEWNKMHTDRLPQKEKDRIYNEIIFKIKEFEGKV